MALPEFNMRQLLEAGVHFGHQTSRWNPKMDKYIYGSRNGIHIMDLTQTVPLLDQALQVIRDTVAKGGRVLFVGTKRQAAKPIMDAAEKSAQFYMNHRWLGGTLTNWQTVSQSINRLKAIDEAAANGFAGLTKKERLGMEREQGKLQASLGGIREMGGVPDLLFVNQDLVGSTQLQFSSEINSEVDVVFLCLGHGNSTDFLKKHQFSETTKIVDLSNDFRLKADCKFQDKTFVYGLPELDKDSI
ncbi:30S ribosomal protein S2, partial [Yoonia sp.]|uniref:30S ribosomal protein S2 n=1 Tax=Yoonia sp. TaxID=2212373 RepID=UPI003976A7FF